MIFDEILSGFERYAGEFLLQLLYGERFLKSRTRFAVCRGWIDVRFIQRYQMARTVPLHIGPLPFGRSLLVFGIVSFQKQLIDHRLQAY